MWSQPIGQLHEIVTVHARTGRTVEIRYEQQRLSTRGALRVEALALHELGEQAALLDQLLVLAVFHYFAALFGTFFTLSVTLLSLSAFLFAPPVLFSFVSAMGHPSSPALCRINLPSSITMPVSLPPFPQPVSIHMTPLSGSSFQVKNLTNSNLVYFCRIYADGTWLGTVFFGFEILPDKADASEGSQTDKTAVSPAKLPKTVAKVSKDTRTKAAKSKVTISWKKVKDTKKTKKTLGKIRYVQVQCCLDRKFTKTVI